MYVTDDDNAKDTFKTCRLVLPENFSVDLYW